MNDSTSLQCQGASSSNNDSNLCLLLLGKTGHGKSATGNAILGSKHFTSSPSCESVTTYAHTGVRNIDGRTIKVVDTPGLGDTRLDTEENAKKAMQGFNNGVALCPEGFHALILVFKFGQRMTSEEKDSIKSLKEMLGENIIREWTILLISHGDHFDEDEVGMGFTEWCKAQGGYMKDLLQECNHRCILFNNKAKVKSELSRQRQQLLDYVHSLKSNGKRYTNQLFEEARETWRKLNRERKYAEVIEHVDSVLSEISNDLQAALEKGCDAGQTYFDRLEGKLHLLRDSIKDVAEPEKGKMEAEIKVVKERMTICKMQVNDEKKKLEMQSLRKLIEESTKEHQKAMQDLQEKFMKERKAGTNVQIHFSLDLGRCVIS